MNKKSFSLGTIILCLLVLYPAGLGFTILGLQLLIENGFNIGDLLLTSLLGVMPLFTGTYALVNYLKGNHLGVRDYHKFTLFQKVLHFLYLTMGVLILLGIIILFAGVLIKERKSLNIWVYLSVGFFVSVIIVILYVRLRHILKGILYYRKGKIDEAIQYLLKVLEKYPDIFGANYMLANCYYRKKDMAKAQSYIEKALLLNPKSPKAQRLKDFIQLAKLYSQHKEFHERKQYSDAVKVVEEALRIEEKILGINHPSVANSLSRLGNLYYAQKEYEKAESALERALAIDKKMLGENHTDTVTTMFHLARTYYSQAKYSEAKPLLNKTLEIYEKSFGKDHAYVASTLYHLALLQEKQGEYAQAEAFFKQTLTILEKAVGSDYPDKAEVLEHMAGLYKNMGKEDEAKLLEERAKEMSSKNSDTTNRR